MQTRYINRHSFYCLCAVTLMVYTAFAENNFSSAATVDWTESDCVESYQMQTAMDGLCREMRLDPCRSTIQENLSLVLSSPLLSAKQRADVLLIQDLIVYIGNIRQQVDYLTLKRDQMQKALANLGHNNLNLENNLIRIQKNADRGDEAMLEGGNANSGHNGSLEVIIGFLNDQKEQLLGQWQYLQQQQQWLARINKNKDETLTQPIFWLTDQPFEIFAEDISSVNVHGIGTELNDQIYSENAHFDATRKQDDLAQEVVSLSLKMSEMESLLQRKTEMITSLQDKLNEVEQRFLLGQKIIQEKDGEISNLNNVLRQQTDGGDRISMSKDQKLTELAGILSIYKDKLLEEHRAARENAKMVKALKQRLDVMQGQMEEKGEALAKTQEDLHSLQEKLQAVESQLNVIKNDAHQVGSQSFNIDKEIYKLQSKFMELQHFLLVNLYGSDKIKAHILTLPYQP